MAKNHFRLMRLLALLMCALVVTSILAQDVPAQTPTDVVVDTVTETAVDVPPVLPTVEVTPLPTDVATEAPTVVETVTETATDAPTALPTVEVTVPTDVATVSPTSAPSFPVEPALTLVIRDLFQDAQGQGVLTNAWTAPAGWTLAAVVDGAAVQIDAATSGLVSAARYQDAYNNLAVMGYFSFVNAIGTAQLIVRESAAGSYVGSLDASGLVTLVKQDANGTIVSVLGSAVVPATETARTLRLSVIGDVLRVSVDDVEVIAVQDTAVLPAGTIRVGVTFPAPAEGQSVNGVILFDNFFVWLPTGETPIVTPVSDVPTVEAPTATDIVTEPSVVVTLTEAPSVPTVESTAEPTTEPTAEPTTEPTVIATDMAVEPTAEATEAVVETTVIATQEPAAPAADPSLPSASMPLPGVTSNDNFANITTVDPLPYANTGDTTNNTVETASSEPVPAATCGGSLIGGTAWYKFTPATTGSYVISTRGSSFDTVFQIYTSVNPTPVLNELTRLPNGCNDDAVGLGAQSQLTISLTANTVYYIQVGGLHNRQGQLKFFVLRPQDITVPTAPVISVFNATTNPNGGLATGAFTNDTTPHLAWNFTGTIIPTSYDVDIATVNTFPAATTLRQPVNHPTRFFEPALTTQVVYYWRVRSLNVMGQASPWSAVYSFTLDTTAPSPVLTLIAPAANAVVQARPAFSWSAVAGTKYRLEIDTDFAAAPAPLAFSNLAAPTFTLTSSLSQGIYLWRVITIDTAGNESTPSVERPFVVDYRTAPLVDAATIAPTTGATANTATVKFTWVAALGAAATTRYSIEIDNDLDGTAETTLHPSPDTSAATTVTSALLPLGDYQYRLVSNNQGTSGWRRFFVSNPLPAAPVLTVPVRTNNPSPSFTWSSVAGINTFDLEYSTSSTFTTGTTRQQIIGVLGFSVPADPNDLPDTSGTPYYVRVRSVNGVGAAGLWSAVKSFILDTAAPPPLTTLTAPAVNAVVATGRPAFSWPAAPVASGASGYIVAISQAANFTPLLITPAPVVTLPTYTIPAAAAFLKQGHYFWSIAVKDAAGNISSSNPARAFDVNYATAPVAGQIFVATGTPTATGKVTFSWTVPAPGRTYKIQIDNNNDGTSDAEFSPTLATGVSIPNVPFTTLGAYRYRLAHTTDGADVSDWRPFFVVSTALQAPLLDAPVPAITSDTTPSFTWKLPVGQTQNDFELQLSTSGTFASVISYAINDLVPVSGVFGVTLSSALPDTPVLGTVYYVRVRSLVDVSLAPSPWSATRSFTLDNAAPPVLLSLTAPANNAIVSVTRPAFSWPAAPAASGANGYIFQLSRLADFSTLVFPEQVVATPAYILPATAPYLTQGTYFWRVLPKDAANNVIRDVAQTVENTFTVNYGLTPANNQVIVPAAATPNQAHVTFTWTAIPATNPVQTGIKVEIATDANFTTIVKTSPMLAATATIYVTSLANSTPNTNPLPSGQYFWRIVPTGHPNPLVYRTFTISGTPAVPVLTFPPAAPVVAINDTTPTFVWTALPNVDDFELQYSTSSTFLAASTITTPIVDGSATSFTVPNDPNDLPDTAGTTYYVRLRAKNTLGVFGPYSATRSFVLDTVAPSAPTLTTPADNAVVSTQKPVFSWGAVPGATRYNLYYAPTLADLDIVLASSVNAITFTPPANLLNDTYYWRVEVIDAAGNVGPLSMIFSFKVTSTPNSAPTAWNFVIDTPNLTWSPLVWATAYEIQVSRTAAFGSNDIVWFSNSVAATNLPNVTVGTPLINGAYYWRVRGVAGPNLFGAYSPVKSFTVEVPN